MVDTAANASTTATFEYLSAVSAFPASVSGLLETRDDTDWIAVTLIDATTYAFFASVSGEGTSDSYLELYDNTGQRVAFDDSNGADANSRFSYATSYTGVYYVAIRETDGNPGQYSIFLSQSAFISKGTESHAGDTRIDGAGVRLLGGFGNDHLTLTGAGGILGEQGNDTIIGSSGSDELSGGMGNDTITANAGDDMVFGDSGNDILSGGDGGDSLFGGTGDDTISGGTMTDTLRGGEGNDRLSGDDGNDSIAGGDGNDILDAGPGAADRLLGGNGNDAYIIRAAGQTIDESYSSGVDRVTSAVHFNLGSPASVVAGSVIENLTLAGAAAINGAGNGVANVMIGNAANNRLTGLGGKDTLTGGLGNDKFVYVAAADSRGTTKDVIKDFDDLGNDRIDLSALFAGTLTYKGLGALSGLNQVHIKDIAGPSILVEVNLTGSLAPDLTIRLKATTAASMTASDFVL